MNLQLLWEVSEISKLASEADALVLVKDEQEVDLASQFLSFFIKSVFVLNAQDRDIYSPNSTSIKNAAQRSKSLSQIAAADSGKIVIISASTFFQKLPNPEHFIDFLELKTRMKLSPDYLSSKLIDKGFCKVSVARAIGEFSQKGDIVDVMIGEGEGYRTYFDYDQLSHIKTFDTYTQRSIEEVDQINIYPLNELILSQEAIESFSKKFDAKLLRREDQVHYEMILKGISFCGIENIWPAFFNRSCTILDFLSNPSIFCDFDIEAEYKIYLQKAQQNLEALKTSTDLVSNLDEILIYEPNNLPIKILKIKDETRSVPNFYFNAQHNANKAEELVLDFIKDSKTKIIISGCRIASFLEEKNIKYQKISLYIETNKDLVNLYEGQLPNFISDEFIIINDTQIYGTQTSKKAKRKSSNLKQYVFELNNFENGEFVVHQDYGIGKFCGVEVITVENLVRDYVKVLYADDDKVYIPVENIDLIKKFGEGDPRLDKLGSTYWQKRKAGLKSRITELAHQLVNSAAHRSFGVKDPLVVNHESYQNFCKLFPHVETPDQEAAIEDIMNDFRNGKVVDRLICGDVGYGKTEVAMRATFFVLDSDPKAQVAIISPTTVLSRQHFLDFEERFKPIGFSVAQLSRLTLKPKKIKDQIKTGEISIVVGTHALLNKNMEFKNLKLVIIDEEHQFGVKQKEVLKTLKQNCHVISLSATPIPRTLQMSLIGIKDLSLIATPPFERQPIKTFIIEKNLFLLAEVIGKELARGGQVFYVVPKIENIESCKEMLLNLNLNLKIGIAHGGIDAEELDKVLQGFYDGEYDVLLSTNIIQSGLDIPNANTIIIDNAHLFGLSQLYQLRGRVGRSNVQGYSYFIANMIKTDTLAYRRLQIIQSNQDLGSGFNIASYDMELRGYGNLLGDQQSGVIREVGIELYQDMLREAVERIKDNKEEAVDDYTPKLNLQISVHIPDEYINDPSLRLMTYRRVASIDSEEEGKNLLDELADRFGTPPIEVANLLGIAKIKSICKSMKISSFEVGPKGFVVAFRSEEFIPILIELVSRNPGQLKLRADGSLVIIKKQDGKTDEEKLDYIFEVLEKLKKVVYEDNSAKS